MSTAVETPAHSVAERLAEEDLREAHQDSDEVARHHAAPSRILERAVATSVLGLSILGYFGARSVPVANETGGLDPRWWPANICLVAIALSAILLVVSFRSPPFDRDDLEPISEGGWFRLFSTLLLSTAFVVAWNLTGNFVVPCALLLATLVWVYGARGWKTLALFPVVTSGCIYLLFHTLLKVPL